VRPAGEVTGGAGGFGARYRAQKREFLGIGLSCLSDEAFVDAVRQAVETRSRLTISFINPDYVLRGHKTAGLVDKMNEFDIVLPDG
jgi:N-acetylglucosaminyldiphosphoundecaprenol N-acetyl-beta-D-mannosaminyltransferase